jgi:hypothetical protein
VQLEGAKNKYSSTINIVNLPQITLERKNPPLCYFLKLPEIQRILQIQTIPANNKQGYTIRRLFLSFV